MQPARGPSRPARLLRAAALLPRPTTTTPSAALGAAQQHAARTRPYSQGRSRSSSSSAATPPSKPWRRTFIRDDDPEAADSVRSTLHTLLRQPRPTPTYHGARPFLARIGKCLAFGCGPWQTAEAARIVRAVVRDWEYLQMGQTNNATAPEAVFHTRFDLLDMTAGSRHPAWGEIPRMFTPMQISEKAATLFLDYVVATARPDSQVIWNRIQKQQRKSMLLEQHGIATTPSLVLRDARFPVYMSLNRVRSSQDVSVYTRLEKVEEHEDRVRFSLRTALWSHKYMDFIAEAQLTYIFKPYPGTIGWFLSEMDRVSEFSTPGVEEQLDSLTKAIRKLERATWDRADAVEDFGSASPANSA